MNSNTKYSVVLSNEKQSSIKDNTEKNQKTVNFGDTEEKSGQKHFSDYKNYYSTNYGSKTHYLKSSSNNKKSFDDEKLDSARGKKTSNDLSNYKSKLSNTDSQNELDPKINLGNKIFLLENKEKLANSIYNYQD